MDLEFYVRVRTCEKRVTGKQPLHKKQGSLQVFKKAIFFHNTIFLLKVAG